MKKFPKINNWAFFYHISAFGLICFLLLPINHNALYYGYDGAYMQQLIDMHFNWANAWTTDLIMNPLQGLGNFSFPINYWFSPASTVTFFFSSDGLNPILIYALTAIEFFCSVWFLSSAAGASRFVQISASWTSSILIGLLFVPHSSSANFYPIAGLIPWIVESIAFSNAIIASLILMCNAEKRLSLLWAIAAVALTIISIIAFPYSSILAIPLFIAFFLIFIVKNKPAYLHDYIGKFIVFLLLILLTPPLLFVMELVLYSVPTFFNNELVYGRPGLVFISIIFHGVAGIGWISTLVFICGLFGALYIIRSSSGIFRQIALFYFTYSTILVGSGIILTFILTSYRGPSMLYFEWFLYPFMFIFGCTLIEALLPSVGRKLNRIYAIIHFDKLIKKFPSEFVLPATILVIVFIFNDPRQYSLSFWPQKETEISQYLKERIELNPGKTWQGSVVTFNNPLPNEESTSWLIQNGYDRSLWKAKGNDHRASGLWWHGIPTLFSYNQFMPPDYYFLVTRLFAKPKDIQQRSIVVLSKYDAKLLQLFGVRYVITSKPIFDSKNAILRVSFDLPDLCIKKNECSDKQFLYELLSPNLGNYSPKKKIVEPNASDAIHRIQASEFNPQEDVVLHNSISGELESATDSVLIFEKGGIRVIANSPSQSLLLLPLQYSHCLVFDAEKSTKSNNAELLRANIGLTAIRFSGNINQKINLSFGPFSNVGCRIRDYIDATNLSLGKN